MRPQAEQFKVRVAQEDNGADGPEFIVEVVPPNGEIPRMWATFAFPRLAEQEAERLRPLMEFVESRSREAGYQAALREAARIAREHKSEVIAQGEPDTVIDSYIDGTLAGYRDAVQQIADAIEQRAREEGR